MEDILASWEVEYEDGTRLSQYVNGEEQPYRAIQWSKVSRLIFESQLVKQTFDIVSIPDLKLSLRSRHFIALDGAASMCFILLGSKPDVEVGAESTVFAFYWFPDGSTHDCTQFDCGDVRQYGSGLVHGLQGGLMPLHGTIGLLADARVGS